MTALIDSLDLWLVACIFYGLLVLVPENRKDRILNILIGIDQALWTLITAGNGSPDETISAAAWRMEGQGKVAGFILRPLVDAIFWFDEDHCRRAFESERTKAQLPKIYR